MENQEHTNNKNVSLSLIAEYGGSDTESEGDTRNTGNDSDTAELSEMVLKNNIINACAHGPLTRAEEEEDEEYEMASAGHMIIDPQSEDVGYEVPCQYIPYREENDSETSSSSDSDSEVDSVKDVEEISSGDEESGTSKTAKPEAPKVNGELGIDELPPIEDLAISLPAQETTKIGTIYSIIEQLVVVKAFPGTPAVDLDSVLFLDNGAKALGKVFDVFGPVNEPHYAVRFNSAAHAAERGAALGADVYIAPRSRHTTYVFLPDLMKIKGSDASWKNDVEPPPSQIEYSDDEEERRARREARQKHQPDNETGENSKRKQPERRNHRPSESSSRFGSAPSRGRNPFSAGSRRNPNTFQRFARPHMEVRTPQPHPDQSQFGAPPFFPMYPPVNMNTPPPFMCMRPRMRPMLPNGPPPIGVPIFGSNFCNMNAPQPQWVNTDPPPPPGT